MTAAELLEALRDAGLKLGQSSPYSGSERILVLFQEDNTTLVEFIQLAKTDDDAINRSDLKLIMRAARERAFQKRMEATRLQTEAEKLMIIASELDRVLHR